MNRREAIAMGVAVAVNLAPYVAEPEERPELEWLKWPMPMVRMRFTGDSVDAAICFKNELQKIRKYSPRSFINSCGTGGGHVYAVRVLDYPRPPGFIEVFNAIEKRIIRFGS